LDLSEKVSKTFFGFDMSQLAKGDYILGSMLLGVERAYLTLSARNHRENTKQKQSQE
jgi:hypothetical protein